MFTKSQKRSHLILNKTLEGPGFSEDFAWNYNGLKLAAASPRGQIHVFNVEGSAVQVGGKDGATILGTWILHGDYMDIRWR